MKKFYHISVQEKDNFAIAERKYYEMINPGYFVTGATLHERYPDGSGITYIVFRGDADHKRTRYLMCRDCGDHYIIARFSRYDRVEKDTLEITVDVEDR